ncbi:peptidoglycan-binding domain-containing protein [Streptomyces sp. NPDC005408]|uniref:peptidoglycan-binding domain-containing protein n=1 Tax=Streptomyces sp. NPDC005408 TaxID=3155341 RepID=UPI0033A294A3
MKARKRIALFVAAAALGSGIALMPSAAGAADTGGVSITGSRGCNYTDAQPTIRRGSKGAAVRQAQCLLKTWNVDIGPAGVDGDFGPTTDRAVREFQGRIKDICNMPVDGIVGPKTWSALKNPLC